MRYFIAVLIGIGLIILVFALIFHNGGSNSGTGSKKLDITQYANASSEMRLTIDGHISATQTHYDAQITIDQSEATIDIIQGYEGNVVDSKSYPMNPTSYAVFLHALDKAGFAKGNDDKAASDERGICPTGRRYIFEAKDGSTTLERYWASSCGQGTFRGNSALTLSLFEAQIPDYQDMVNRVAL